MAGMPALWSRWVLLPYSSSRHLLCDPSSAALWATPAPLNLSLCFPLSPLPSALCFFPVFLASHFLLFPSGALPPTPSFCCGRWRPPSYVI